MKMVKFGGKEVPFFAADGKGANDLKKALGGAMVRRRAEMGAKVKEKPYRYMRYGGEVEMAMGGRVRNPMDLMEMGTGGMVKYEEGGAIKNGDSKPSFFIVGGFDNRGDDPSGREIGALFMRTEDGGVQQINPGDLMEYFPDAKNIYEAYEEAGIPIRRGGGGSIMFPQLGDDPTDGGRDIMIRHNRALKKEFGVESMEELRQKLNIARVPFERKRDMGKMVEGYRPELDMPFEEEKMPS